MLLILVVNGEQKKKMEHEPKEMSKNEITIKRSLHFFYAAMVVKMENWKILHELKWMQTNEKFQQQKLMRIVFQASCVEYKMSDAAWKHMMMAKYCKGREREHVFWVEK